MTQNQVSMVQSGYNKKKKMFEVDPGSSFNHAIRLQQTKKKVKLTHGHEDSIVHLNYNKKLEAYIESINKQI